MKHEDILKIKTIYRAEFEIGLYEPSYIRIDEFEVIKHTFCGVWINVRGKDKWVSMETCKRFAYPTKKEAYESFYRRKIRHVQILKSQLKSAKKALKMIEKKVNK